MTLDELTLIHKALIYAGYGDRDKALVIINREISLKELEKNPTGSENEMSQR